MPLDNLTLVAGVGLLVALAQWAAWRARLPTILFLLLTGMLIGPVAGILDPDALFGELLFPLISLSVAAILFEGSLTLKYQELRDIGKTVRNLVTLGALITWGITTVIVHLLVGFDLDLAILFGAMVVVTGPTVVVPMLRTVRPIKKIANILRWEGIVIDPIGALLAVLAFDFYITTHKAEAVGSIIVLFLEVVAVGVVLGVLAGYGLGIILRRQWLPEYLRSPFTLLMVFVVFALAEMIEHESGWLAVTLFGVVLTNQKGVDVRDILDFKESLAVLLIGGLFILLAARIELQGLVAMGWSALLVVGGIIFIARPLSVFISTLGSDLMMKERLLIAWIGPRGIVCAAVAAIFAIRLEAIGAKNAELLVPLAFLIIIGTVVVQSLTAKPLATLLKLRDPAPAGFLIVGGGRVARMIASILVAQDLRVVLSDSDWNNIKRARMEGLETYFGNPISERADRYLDLSGIGKLISITGLPNLDDLQSLYFRREFGAQHIYELPSAEGDALNEPHRIASQLRGQRLFGKDMTTDQLETLLAHHWTVKTTLLTEEFDYEDYADTYRDRSLVLFVIDASGRLHPRTQQDDWQPTQGWQVVSLTLAE